LVGQFKWTVHGVTGGKVILTGRAEMVSRSQRISTSYSCGEGCPPTYSGFIEPGGLTLDSGSTGSLTDMETGTYSNGTEVGPFQVPGISWSSYDPSVATVGDGTVEAHAAGETSISSLVDIQEHYMYDAIDQVCLDDGYTYNVNGGTASVTVRPRISGPAALWWFFNENPSGYATSITLTASSGSGSYSWQITNGGDKIQFSNNSSSIVTSTNQVTVKSINSSGTKLDCGIQVTVAGVPSNEIKLTSLTPWSLTLISRDHLTSSATGFESHINYSIKDQFGAVLPSTVPLNEKFPSTSVNDYFEGNDWGDGVEGAINASPSLWLDKLAPPPLTSLPHPGPIPPQSPLLTSKVEHRGQEWYVGSLTIGKGRRVQTDTIQFYLDHGDHISVVSPAP